MRGIGWRIVTGNTLLSGRARIAAAAGVVSLVTFCAMSAAAAALPEGRAYEMVSPPEKGGYDAGGALGDFAAAPDGSGFAFGSIGVFAGVPSDPGIMVYFASRGPEGWSTLPLSPPPALGPGTQPEGDPIDFSADLGLGLSEIYPGQNRGQATTREAVVYYVHAPGSPDTPERFAQASPVLRNVAGGTLQTSYEGANADLSRLIIKSGPALEGAVPAAVSTPGQLYEAEGAGTLRPIGVDDQGNAINCALTLGTNNERFNAVSADGSKVFFTCGGQLYARINATSTIEVPPKATTAFQGASADGSRVFFTTSQSLLAEDENSANDLYMAEIEGEQIGRLVQVSHDPHAGEASDVQGVVRISGDGSHVYFVATGVLTEGANAEGEEPVKGADNLYVYDAKTEKAAFVADLCSGPILSGAVADPRCGSNLSNQQGYLVSLQQPPHSRERHRPINDSMLWEAQDLTREAQVNECGAPLPGECTGAREAGRFLVFSSYAQLTPDDTDGALDVYRYDAGTGRLTRVSVGEDGYNADGNEAFDEANLADAGNIVAEEFTANARIQAPPFRAGQVRVQHELRTRSISENGSRIVFTTASPLSPGAVNGHADVYEWHEGHVGMISSGTSVSADLSPVITPSGMDVFFLTQASLLPQDTGGEADVYDARLGVGFPLAPSLPAGCSGEACRGPLTAAPVPLVAGSLTQPAGGNVTRSSSTARGKAKPNARKLSKALKACRKKPKRRRARCRARARRRYGHGATRTARPYGHSSRKGAN
jgi:hypothetical protein